MSALPIQYPGNDAFGRVRLRGLFMLTLDLLAAVVVYLELRYPSPAQQEVSQTQLFDWIKQGGVTRLVNQPDPATGIRYLTGVYDKPGAPIGFKVPVDLALNPYLLSELKQAGYKGTIETVNNTNIAGPLFLNLVPLTLFLILLALFLRWVYRLFSR
jgi:ATP-dependent Zn protease